MRTLIQDSPAYQLLADLTSTPHGACLRLVSFVPTARRPEEQTRFQGMFTPDELRALYAAIGDHIQSSGAERMHVPRSCPLDSRAGLQTQACNEPEASQQSER